MPTPRPAPRLDPSPRGVSGLDEWRRPGSEQPIPCPMPIEPPRGHQSQDHEPSKIPGLPTAPGSHGPPAPSRSGIAAAATANTQVAGHRGQTLAAVVGYTSLCYPPRRPMAPKTAGSDLTPVPSLSYHTSTRGTSFGCGQLAFHLGLHTALPTAGSPVRRAIAGKTALDLHRTINGRKTVSCKLDNPPSTLFSR